MGGFIYKGDYCMKKELIVLSFLVGSFSLWGMDSVREVDPESRMQFMKRLEENPVVQHALADTPEEKEALSFKLFKQFHKYAFEYFKIDQTQKERIAILTWIRKWLPLIDMGYSQEEARAINAFLTDPLIFAQIINDVSIAENFFTTLYMIYLRDHPIQLCKVVFAYFHVNFIENKNYREFLFNMLKLLGYFADYFLSAPEVKKASNIEKWSEVIDRINEYIKNYEDISKSKERFFASQKQIKFICIQLQNALQREQMEEPGIEVQASINEEPQEPAEEQLDSPVVISPSENPTELKNERTTTQPITQTAVKPEVSENSEPTFWDKVVDGWNRFLNMLKLMGGV